MHIGNGCFITSWKTRLHDGLGEKVRGRSGSGEWTFTGWNEPLQSLQMKVIVKFQVMNMDRTSHTYLMIFYILVSIYGRTEGKSEGIFQIEYSY